MSNTLKISVHMGDITKVKSDAIVNAANSSLLGGAGVDGAIHRAGGPAILEACKQIRARQGSCQTGEAVITTAGNLPASYVIHTVGPVWHGGEHGEKKYLTNCYQNSLKLAEEHSLKSVAFPGISTGIYGYPKKEAAKVAVTVVSEYRSETIEQVTFVCFDKESFEVYQRLLKP